MYVLGSRAYPDYPVKGRRFTSRLQMVYTPSNVSQEGVLAMKHTIFVVMVLACMAQPARAAVPALFTHHGGVVNNLVAGCDYLCW